MTVFIPESADLFIIVYEIWPYYGVLTVIPSEIWRADGICVSASADIPAGSLYSVIFLYWTWDSKLSVTVYNIMFKI